MEVVEDIEELGKQFFEMPLEEKKKYPMVPGTVQGYGQAFIFSEDQKLDWCNMFALGVHPPSIRNPKLWPSKPARFRFFTKKKNPFLLMIFLKNHEINGVVN